MTHDQVLDMLTEHMGDWAPGEPRSWYPVRNGQTGPRVQVEWRKTDQAHICLALRGLSSTHPQRYTMDLLNSILGEGMSSRLFLELREKRGLVYSAYSTSSHYKDAGALLVYFAVHPKNAASALEAALEELRKLARTAPVEELAKVKEMVKGRLLLRMEDTRSVAFWGGSQELLLDPRPHRGRDRGEDRRHRRGGGPGAGRVAGDAGEPEPGGRRAVPQPRTLRAGAALAATTPQPSRRTPSRNSGARRPRSRR